MITQARRLAGHTTKPGTTNVNRVKTPSAPIRPSADHCAAAQQTVSAARRRTRVTRGRHPVFTRSGVAIAEGH